MIITRIVQQSVKQQVKLELPAFFKKSYGYFAIYSENNFIQVNLIDDYALVRKSHFMDGDIDRIEAAESISEAEFKEVLAKTVTYINSTHEISHLDSVVS
jgi:hypothetical protein